MMARSHKKVGAQEEKTVAPGRKNTQLEGREVRKGQAQGGKPRIHMAKLAQA